MFGKIIKFLVALLVTVVVVAVGYVLVSPPDLLRVGTNYSAKIVCSNVFIAGRDAGEVLAVDVQAPGHPLLRHVSVEVDMDARKVEARLFKFFAPATSEYRDGLGCANTHDAALSDRTLAQPDPLTGAMWPQGNGVALSQDPDLLAALSDNSLLGEGHRAVVVVKNGRIVGESYGDGFDADSTLLGWSMTKTITAGLIGTAIQSGQMALTDDLTHSYPHWATDTRKDITVADMLAMTSGLEWNEDYGDVSDVTRMLYLSDDMAGFGASRTAETKVGATFNYSSGTSTMLARVWQDRVEGDGLDYPQKALFGPLGMTTAILEADAKDTFVGSSYMYATARDWARYGQFLLQKGVWHGQQILPEGYVDWMIEPVAASDDTYGNGHLWLEAPGDLPPFEDAFWMRGHDGQSIAIIPSRNLVVVRLGLTPSKLGYSSLPLVKAVIAAIGD